MRAGHQVSWFPAYGPEMRGGTANCSVNIASQRIGSPLVERPNVLVVMNQPSLDAFEKDVVDDGLIIVDTSIVEGRPDTERLNAVLIPASEIADQVGTPKVANVVMLGAIVAATDAFPPDFVESTLRQVIKKKNLIELNMEAFRKGYGFVKEGA
jgi:Pyruvate/2-oxoacid:ferredoxin oxidoreductase gamma subunit